MISLSATSIKRYLDCPARYWREKLAPPELRRKEPPTGPLIVGRAVHGVLEALVRAAVSARKTGIDNEFTRDRQLANVPRMYEKVISGEISREPAIDWGTEGQEAAYQGGLHALRALAVEAISQPISGEEVPFTVALTPDVQLTGRIDAVLCDGNLIDFKTQTGQKFSRYRWTQDKALDESQPPLYALGMHEARGYFPKTFTFLVAEKAAGAVVEPFLVPIVRAHLAWARLSAIVVARFIAQGVFPMPSGKPCDRCFLKNEGGCRPMNQEGMTP